MAVNVLTSEMMREAESKYMALGVSSIELVERAAKHIANEVWLQAPKGTAAFACGTGGNGADGFTAARLYAQMGGRSVIILCGEPNRLTPDAKECMRRALDVKGAELSDSLDVKPDIWVDAIFGIGLKRAISGFNLEAVRAMNRDRENGVPVISADIPSGLNADSGNAYGECVNASTTVTFQCEKPGHLLGIGPDVCGKLITCPIGIPEEFYADSAIIHASTRDALDALKPRPRLSHKGTFGHALIIAGSMGMAGAAIMTAMAALRSGVGLVSVACPKSIVPIIQTVEPCAMCVPLPEECNAVSPSAVPILKEAIKGKSSIVIGPGLTTGASSLVVRLALESGLPLVADADALNIISLDGSLKKLLRPYHIITPHPKEAARLLGKDSQSALECAGELRQTGATVILKGASSIIMGRRTYISTTGCAGLAKGGSGDVLSGILGALLALGYVPTDAGWIGDTLHGELGEITANDIGQTAMTSRDLIGHMGRLWGDGRI